MTPRTRVPATERRKRNSVTVGRDARGASWVASRGAVAFGVIANIVIVAVLIVAPDAAKLLGFVVGALIGMAGVVLGRALQRGTLRWNDVLKANEFHARRGGDGAFSIRADGPVAWFLLALLPFATYYWFASYAAWTLWVGSIVGGARAWTSPYWARALGTK